MGYFYNIFSRCFHGLGHRIQERKYRKVMFFLNIFYLCIRFVISIFHIRIYPIEEKAYQAYFIGRKQICRTWELTDLMCPTSQEAWACFFSTTQARPSPVQFRSPRKLGPSSP
jgi:hypothetical protein